MNKKYRRGDMKNTSKIYLIQLKVKTTKNSETKVIIYFWTPVTAMFLNHTSSQWIFIFSFAITFCVAREFIESVEINFILWNVISLFIVLFLNNNNQQEKLKNNTQILVIKSIYKVKIISEKKNLRNLLRRITMHFIALSFVLLDGTKWPYRRSLTFDIGKKKSVYS